MQDTIQEENLTDEPIIDEQALSQETIDGTDVQTLPEVDEPVVPKAAPKKSRKKTLPKKVEKIEESKPVELIDEPTIHLDDDAVLIEHTDDIVRYTVPNSQF